MIYCTTDWLEVEESCLNDDFLMKTFVDDIHRTIYVLRRGGALKVLYHMEIFAGIFCAIPPLYRKNLQVVLSGMKKKRKKYYG